MLAKTLSILRKVIEIYSFWYKLDETMGLIGFHILNNFLLRIVKCKSQKQVVTSYLHYFVNFEHLYMMSMHPEKLPCQI